MPRKDRFYLGAVDDPCRRRHGVAVHGAEEDVTPIRRLALDDIRLVRLQRTVGCIYSWMFSKGFKFSKKYAIST
jgi:hypothetical protein